jgi:hypothetical protein
MPSAHAVYPSQVIENQIIHFKRNGPIGSLSCRLSAMTQTLPVLAHYALVRLILRWTIAIVGRIVDISIVAIGPILKRIAGVPDPVRQPAP